jgi:hypothetical protein
MPRHPWSARTTRAPAARSHRAQGQETRRAVSTPGLNGSHTRGITVCGIHRSARRQRQRMLRSTRSVTEPEGRYRGCVLSPSVSLVCRSARPTAILLSGVLVLLLLPSVAAAAPQTSATATPNAGAINYKAIQPPYSPHVEVSSYDFHSSLQNFNYIGGGSGAIIRADSPRALVAQGGTAITGRGVRASPCRACGPGRQRIEPNLDRCARDLAGVRRDHLSGQKPAFKLHGRLRPAIGDHRLFDESAGRPRDASAAPDGARLESRHDGGPGSPSSWTTETTSNPAATAIRP